MTTNNEKTFLSRAICGGIAGCVETCITMPFETTKTTQQLQKSLAQKSLLDTGRFINKQRGLRGFYYGLPACLVQASGKVAVRFSFYGFYLNIFGSGNNSDIGRFSSAVLKGCAGLCAGATESCWITPCERLKTLRVTQLNVPKQQETFTSIASTLKQLKSPSNLYVGFQATAIRNGLAVGTRFLLYDELKLNLQNFSQGDQWWNSVVCGFAVGVLTTIISQPADIIKSRMQSNMNEQGKHYQSTLSNAVKTLQNEGLVGFKRGLNARLWKIGCGQAVIFSIYEHVYNLFYY